MTSRPLAHRACALVGLLWLGCGGATIAPTPAERAAAAAERAARVERGSAVFAGNCVACHGERGEGGVGPNLTDGYWLHGATASDVYQTILRGVPAMGMVTWGPILGPPAVADVAAYVLTLRDAPVAGRDPQGVDAAGQPPE